MKIQIILRMCWVSARPLLSIYTFCSIIILLAGSKGTDETARMHRLFWAFAPIWAFAVCIARTCFHMARPICDKPWVKVSFGHTQSLTHCRLNELSYTIYWKILISILVCQAMVLGMSGYLGTSGYDFRYVRLCDIGKWLNYMQTVETLIRYRIFANFPSKGFQTTMCKGGASDNNSWIYIIIGLDKGGYPVNIFLISPRKHMLWVLIRSASPRSF